MSLTITLIFITCCNKCSQANKKRNSRLTVPHIIIACLFVLIKRYFFMEHHRSVQDNDNTVSYRCCLHRLSAFLARVADAADIQIRIVGRRNGRACCRCRAALVRIYCAAEYNSDRFSVRRICSAFLYYVFRKIYTAEVVLSGGSCRSIHTRYDMENYLYGNRRRGCIRLLRKSRRRIDIPDRIFLSQEEIICNVNNPDSVRG